MSHGTIAMMSEEARRSSLAAIKEKLAPDRDLWVFAYASLMWMPAVPVAETRRATLYGHHRSLCLKIDIEFGSVEHPGLWIGTEPHGACTGVAHRIAAENIEAALPILWYRKMMTGAYEPRLIDIKIEGMGKVKSLAFVTNRYHVRFEKLPHDEIVRRVATAEGPGGTNRRLLYRTIEYMHQFDIADPDIERITADVKRLVGD